MLQCAYTRFNMLLKFRILSKLKFQTSFFSHLCRSLQIFHVYCQIFKFQHRNDLQFSFFQFSVTKSLQKCHGQVISMLTTC